MNIWRYVCTRINKLSCHCYLIKLLRLGTNLLASEITKIASRYGFAAGVISCQSKNCRHKMVDL